VNRHLAQENLDRTRHTPAPAAVQVIGSTALGGNKSLACFGFAAAVVVPEAEFVVGVGRAMAAVAAVTAGFVTAAVFVLEVVFESLAPAVPVPELEPAQDRYGSAIHVAHTGAVAAAAAGIVAVARGLVLVGGILAWRAAIAPRFARFVVIVAGGTATVARKLAAEAALRDGKGCARNQEQKKQKGILGWAQRLVLMITPQVRAPRWLTQM
jgi:hypothetical protein